MGCSVFDFESLKAVIQRSSFFEALEHTDRMNAETIPAIIGVTLEPPSGSM